MFNFNPLTTYISENSTDYLTITLKLIISEKASTLSELVSFVITVLNLFELTSI